ncbi:MAG: class I SAM-dependent methyltransferase [Anaerolineales bacterium]
MRKIVNYDEVAPTYNARYAVNPLGGVARHLRALLAAAGGGRALEVGCGTGRWLEELQPLARQVYGFDLSRGMLRGAQARGLPQAALAQGQAGELPFAAGSLDLLYSVNALHHFPRPRQFIAEARRVLRPGGALAIIAMDPRAGQIRWYLYDYFPETLPADLERFPSAGTLIDWMAAEGFEQAGVRRVERLTGTLEGRAVLADPFLQKNGTSQLTLLSDEAYAAGRARLARDLDEAESRGETMRFETDIWMTAVVAEA